MRASARAVADALLDGACPAPAGLLLDRGFVGRAWAAGYAQRGIRRARPALVDAETATWNLADPREEFTYRRVLPAR